MGVPGLKTWLEKELPEVWSSSPKKGVDHVYVDLNFVLHTCLHRCKPKTRYRLRQNLEQWLNKMLRVNPNKSLFLAIDGPGPLAKVLHQRANRAQEARKLQRQVTKSNSIGYGEDFVCVCVCVFVFFKHQKALLHVLSNVSFPKLKVRLFSCLSNA